MKLNRIPFILALIAALCYLPGLGNADLFDWDEINFAEISREMVVSGNWLTPTINFETFTEKPPLFFWLQAASMSVFGINEFAARFPNALCGILLLPLLFIMGKRLYNARFGLLWSLVWFGSLLPSFYFKTGLIDPVFNLFTCLGIYQLIVAIHKKSENKQVFIHLFLAGIFTGLAILTKGPTALLVTGLTLFVFWIVKRFRWFLNPVHILFYLFATIATAGIWFGLITLQNGSAFIEQFTIRQWELLTTPDAGHGGFLLYHFPVVFIGCFPGSILLIEYFFQKKNTAKRADTNQIMLILFWVVLILFTLVKTKILHYSSLTYFPLTFLGAFILSEKKNTGKEIPNYSLWFTGIFGGIIVFASFAFALLVHHVDVLKPFLSKDPFAVENLEAQIQWTGFEALPALILAIALMIAFIKFKKEAVSFWTTLFVGMAIWLQLTLHFFIANIGGISQQAHVDFCKAASKMDVYITTYGFKSYVPFYYGQSKMNTKPEAKLDEWLKTGAIDKPVFFIAKTNTRESLEMNYPKMQKLYHKNGFYFYVRLPEHQ